MTPVTLCLASLLAVLIAPGDATQLTSKIESQSVPDAQSSTSDPQVPDSGPKLTVDQALRLAEQYSPILQALLLRGKAPEQQYKRLPRTRTRVFRSLRASRLLAP